MAARHTTNNDRAPSFCMQLGQATTEGRTSVLHFAMADSKALPDIFGDSMSGANACIIGARGRTYITA
jgi:hypothetical protein